MEGKEGAADLPRQASGLPLHSAGKEGRKDRAVRHVLPLQFEQSNPILRRDWGLKFENLG